MKFKNKNVTVVRDVKAGEAEYDANTPKVVIEYDDGRQETVAKVDVSK